MKSNFRLLLCVVALIAARSDADTQAAMVGITPSLDNTIYSESTNSNALGSVFSGSNASGGVRRGLLQFDIAGNIPAGATIQSVSLELYQLKHSSGSVVEDFVLHRLTQAWGEGTSSTVSGAGTTATSGDATWVHRLFSNDLWISPGGDFDPSVSGTGAIGIVDNTAYTFGSQSGLVADVQNWLNSPGTNFGWILRAANESMPSNAREFASGENLTSSRWPTLTVEYTAVPEPGSLMLAAVALVFASSARARRRA